jgi:DNA modification methylase
MSLELDKIHLGDCLDILKTFPEGKIDLIVTSPLSQVVQNIERSYYATEDL